jgi:hypothetical protein
MNTSIVIGAIYILGYLNPDTREAFMWAGAIVAGLIGTVGLVWIAGQVARAKKSSSEMAATVAAQPLIGAHERFERRVSEVAETDSDAIGV